MELTKQELEQLKAMLPNVKTELKPELERALKAAERGIKKIHTEVCSSLSESLKSYDNLCKKGYKPIYNQCHSTRNPDHSGYIFTYEKPDSLIKKETKVAVDKVKTEHSERVAAAELAALDDLIADHLKQQRQEQETQAKQQEQLLKEKLLQQLFS